MADFRFRYQNFVKSEKNENRAKTVKLKNHTVIALPATTILFYRKCVVDNVRHHQCPKTEVKRNGFKNEK